MTAAPRALDLALGGWQANGILTLQTALPMQISQSGNNTFLGSSPGQRPYNNGKSAKNEGPIDQSNTCC